MTAPDTRPSLWIGHVVLETDRLADSAQFMRTIGMRPIHEGPTVAIFELRGGTHLILLPKKKVKAGDAPFDLMVDDLRATHERFAALGLEPTPIEALPKIDHELFHVREPAGHRITVYSSHVAGRAV
jgi:hypothetical protein